ncbi:MAG TPA: helix-turn-helix domain-containing protein [Mycobacterium sp.]|nr:helix-turn-helix domain-containing protein [Mycobacterium sp.]
MTERVPLRTRQRAALLSDIRRTAHRLFAEHGYDAVTTEDIAAAVGVSTSTFFRHVSTKESLLIEPLLENISGMVGAYEARPPAEHAGPALIAAMVDAMTNPDADETRTWLTAIRSAPHLINRVTLVAPLDRERLIKLTAERMADPDPTCLRSALLVHTLLAASEYVFQQWIAGTTPGGTALPDQVESALTIVLSANWEPR